MFFSHKVVLFIHNNNMKKILNFKNLLYLLPLVILMIFSLLNLYYAPNLSSIYNNFFQKQILWFLIAIFLFIITFFIKPKFILKISPFIYYINLFLLLLVLFIGKEVNGSKAWFSISFFSFQPSEFMKLSLILYSTHIITAHPPLSNKEHIILLLRLIIIFLLPAILTFLEPDTGAVIIYFFITSCIILFSRIKLKYILITIGIVASILGSLTIMYYYFKDNFISLFGSSIYYRIERLIDFKNGGGMQIENALTTIATSKFISTPQNATNLYFPEAATDFIFALNINHFGILGGILILLCYLLIDFIIIYNFKKIKNLTCQILIIGFLAMFLYQQVQNIFMNLGLLPIVGIPLPFFSYGGSSLILFFISLAIIIRIIFENKKYSYRVFYR